MMKKVMFLCFAAALLSLCTVPGAFAQDKTYTIRIGNVTAPDNPLNVAFEKMAAEMNEKSKGRIQAKVFPSSQLGNLRSMTEAVQMGTLEMSTQSAGGLASFYAPMGVMEMPFAYKSHQHVYKVVDGTIGQDLGEQFRVLRPGGRLALVWNSRDYHDPWMERLSAIIGNETVQDDDVEGPGRESGLFGPVGRAQFSFAQELDRDGLLDLVLSRSYCAKLPPGDREPILEAVPHLYDETADDDGVRLAYVTECFRAARA